MKRTKSPYRLFSSPINSAGGKGQRCLLSFTPSSWCFYACRWNSLLHSLFSTAMGTRNTSVDKGTFSRPYIQGSPESTQRCPSWASSACERFHSALCAVLHPLLSVTLSVGHYHAHSFQKTKLCVRNTRGCSQEFTEQADRLRVSAQAV